MNHRYAELHSTYSIVARDPETGRFGVAVQTHQMCVGAHVLWLLPDIGALATQAMTNLSFGPMGLAMLEEGVPAPQIVDGLVASDPKAHSRQLAVVDTKARVSAWTGDNCIAEATHHLGQGYSVQANMMTKDTVVPAMAHAFEESSGDFAQRIMAALAAAQAEDGDIRGMQSAALKIVRGDPEKEPLKLGRRSIFDLRVDEHQEPLKELDRLVRLRRAQLQDHIGYDELEEGMLEKALDTWEGARRLAPELEEMGFWQAVTLADNHEEVDLAVKILQRTVLHDHRRREWIDLIRRIQDCGIIERQGAGDELIAKLNDATAAN
jgi:uncharacterized Ntn-hydrolase superfamily protein